MKVLAAVVAALALGPGAAAQEATLTVDQAVAAALASARPVRQAESSLASAGLRLRLARETLWPQVSVSAEAQHHERLGFFEEPPAPETVPGASGNRYSIGVDMDPGVLTLGRRLVEVRLAESVVRLARLERGIAERQVVFAVKRAYNEAFRMQERRDLRLATRSVFQRNVAAARARYANEAIAKLDLILAELRAANFDDELQRAESSYRASLAALLDLTEGAGTPRLVGHPPTPPSAPTPDSALEANPDLRRIDHQVAAARLAVEAARTPVLGNLSLFATYSYRDLYDLENTEGYQIGVRVRVQPSDLYGRGERIDLARRSLERLELQRDALAASLSREVVRLLDETDRLRALIRRTGEVARMADEALPIVEAGFVNGRLGALEMESALRAFMTAKDDNIDALAAHGAAATRLEEIASGP